MADVDAPCLPIVLLPVRIETRYRTNNTQLAIRIFPDTVHVNAHEPKLTDDERAAGNAYIVEAAGSAPDARLKAWRKLASLFGPQRAAWIARATTMQPPPARRTFAWEQAPTTNVLPDRWVARGYKDGKTVFTQSGNDIADTPLALGPSFAAKAAAGPLPIDDDMLWMVDFNRAVAVGMGIVVPLPQPGQRLDQLIVVGVKGKLDAPSTAARLTALLDAHHYTRGLGFVPEETPTNNTPDAPSGYSTRDDDFSQSFDVETNDKRGDKTRRGAAWTTAQALGVDASVFAHVRNADTGAGMDASRAAMNAAVWPATWGYFFSQLMAGRVSDNGLRAARDYFASWVRACGPLPVLRIDDQPYGLLPAISLDHWRPVGDGDMAGLVPFLGSGTQSLRGFWRDSLKNVPVAGSGGDLVKSLALQPRSVSYRARNLLGPDYTGALFRYFRDSLGASWRKAHTDLTGGPLQRLQLADWHPRLEDGAWATQWYPFIGPTVEGAPPPLAAKDYLAALADPARSAWRQLRDEQYGGIAQVPRPSPLLYLVARSSLLVSYSLAAAKQLGRPLVEGELVEIDPDLYTVDAKIDPPLVPWDLLDGVAGSIGQKQTQVDAVRNALASLAPLPAETLDRLLAESIDLCSYRLDAWMTSFASRRLRYLRETAGVVGTLVGGYGWGENLAPGAGSETTGYIPAPSIAHANAAAMLAAGHLAHEGRGDPTALAVDLRSDRVRLALWLLDGVRQGQPLPALLGYRFERALQGAGAAAASIPAFRQAFPLVGTAVGNGASAAATSASTAVVDGWSLARAWAATSRTQAVFGTSPFPPVTVKPADVVAALNQLDGAVDALSDSLLAEGVYQLARGNPTRAAASLEALSTGSSLPADLEFASTPRTGTGLTHRLVVLLQAAAVGTATTPRAVAEPSLNRWAAYVLGDPARIVARVDWHKPDGSVLASKNFSVAELVPVLSPLDLVYGEQAEGAPSELERRLLFHARRHRPPAVTDGTPATVFLGRIGAGVSFTEALELARALREVLANARPLGPADLQRPNVVASGAPAAAELVSRAGIASAALDALAAELTAASADAERLRTALLKAATFGIPGAIPPDSTAVGPAAVAGLATQVATIRVEVDRRRAAAKAPMTPPSDPLQSALDRLQAAFGLGFRALPTFSGVPAPFDVAFSRSLALQGNDATASVAWLQRVSRVRPGAARLNEVLTYAELLGTGPTGRLSVEQLPYPSPTSTAQERWCALPFPTPAQPPVGRVAFAVHVVPRADRAPISASQPLAGIVIDEWTETIPSVTETAAVALDAPTPSSSPPQTILIAVPPDATSRWTTDTLAATVAQTFELAQIRSVDVDALEGLGQYLPATYFALNLSGATVSTDLQRASGVPLA